MNGIDTPSSSPSKKKDSPFGFTLVELMVIIAILGIIASVAIPHFVQYLRRARTTETAMNIRRLYDASVMYYSSDRSNITGGIVAKTFPRAEGPTPVLGTCCVSPGGKCAPFAGYWQTSTWTALHFAVDDPFYYLYHYMSSGSDSTAAFTAAAFGDLNCDTRYSTYERIGSINEVGDVVGSAGLYVDHDVD